VIAVAPSRERSRTYSWLVRIRLFGGAVHLDAATGWHRPGRAFGDPQLAPTRPGQRAFQGVVRGAYAHRCSEVHTLVDAGYLRLNLKRTTPTSTGPAVRARERNIGAAH
jgi:hypothetical protein